MTIEKVCEKLERISEKIDMLSLKVEEIIEALPELEKITRYSKAVDEFIDKFIKNE